MGRVVDKDYMRSLPALGCFLIIIDTAACSGSAPLVPSGNPAAHHQPGVSTLTTMDAPGSIDASGPIVALISGGFTINAGAGKGNVHVYVNSSTTVTGTIAVANTASVVGTGSFATSITATSVVVSGSIPASTAVSVSGPIGNLISGGFTLNGGPSVGNIHVYTGSSTAIGGGPVTVGSYAQATGTGSLATSITAGYVAVFPSAPPPIAVELPV